LGRDVHVCGVTARRRHPVAFLAKALQVELDRVSHRLLHPTAGSCRRDATRKIGRVGREAALRLLDDNQESHGFNPACLKILLSVPGAKEILADEIEQTVRFLAWMPGAGTLYPQARIAGLRRLYVRRASSHLYYTFTPGAVTIRAFWHAKEKTRSHPVICPSNAHDQLRDGLARRVRKQAA